MQKRNPLFFFLILEHFGDSNSLLFPPVSSLSSCLSCGNQDRRAPLGGAWVAQSLKHLPLAQIVILGIESLLSVESASPPACVRALCLCQINKQKLYGVLFCFVLFFK